MSSQEPRRPGRRRIAGERRPGRPDAARGGRPPNDDRDDRDDRPEAGPEEPRESRGEARRHSPRESRDDSPRESRRHSSRDSRRGGPSVAVLLCLGLLALVLVAGASWYGVPRLRAVQAAHAADEARRTAPAVAERAAVPILSYGYTSLDTDKSSAVRFMTARYRKTYVDTFDSLVEDNARKLHARVKAKVVGSGVSAAEPDRARVLLYVDQTTTSTANGGNPQVALNRVMFDMVRRGDTWLVNGITSY